MPPPVFGPDEIDQNPNSVSLSAVPLGQYWSNYFANGAQGPNRAAVGLNTTNADAARTWQQQLIQDLQQAAAGNPNSAAQKGLTSAYGEARAGQSALGSSLRGTGGGAGLRAGAAGAANVQRGFEGDKAMLMLKEKEAAQALLAQQLAAQRGLDAQQANMMAGNAQQNQGLEDAMRQFYTQGGIQGDLAAMQTQADRTRASLGFDLEGQDAQRDATNRWMEAGATGAGVAARYAARSGGSGYRQVDGQNSIVPDWDK